jgi:hypothetical protein
VGFNDSSNLVNIVSISEEYDINRDETLKKKLSFIGDGMKNKKESKVPT